MHAPGGFLNRRFVSEEATLGQAATVAGMSQTAFLRELGQRRIPLHYGLEELAEDLKAVREFRELRNASRCSS